MLQGFRSRLAQVPERGCWAWPLAWTLVLMAFSAWVANHGPADGARRWMGSALSTNHSLFPVACAALVGAWPGRWGIALRLVHGVAAAVLLAWHVASIELFLDQGRTLTPAELWFRLTDTQSRAFVIETLCSYRTAGAALLLAFALTIPALLAARLPRRACFAAVGGLLALAQVGGIFALGSEWFGDPDYYVKVQRPFSAPWSWTQDYRYTPHDNGPISELAADAAAAAEVRKEFDPAFWAAGPDPTLGSLCGRYQGRNLVVLLLESHRLSDVTPFGDDAFGHQDLSPRLSALSTRGIAFTNYIQAGLGTFFAQYSLITGLPSPAEFDIGQGCAAGAPLARLGRVADLAREGYRCEWLQATPTRFASWEDFLQVADMPNLIDPQETKGFARDCWSSWGMPDEQLLAIAMRRYLEHLAAGRRSFQVVLTISNHSPFLLPTLDGAAFSRNHTGGMRYADHWAARFAGELLALPVAQRPVIFVTGDHAHREGLLGARPLGQLNPEGYRIPGLLLLPDGQAAGTVCTSLFAHEDLFDLLYALTSAGPSQPAKFTARHRTAVSTIIDARQAIVTHDGFYYEGRAYSFATPWTPVRDPSAEMRARLEAAFNAAVRDERRCWQVVGQR